MISPPPGRRTLAISPKKTGMFTWATRSKESSGKGSFDASATRKVTLASGSRPILAWAFATICAEMSTPRIDAVGNSRARNSVPAPVPHPRSRTLSGLDSRASSPAARVARCSAEPAPVRSSQPDAARSKNLPTEAPITGHAHGAVAARRQMVRPIRIVLRSGPDPVSGTP